jgi:hypothetical protein
MICRIVRSESCPQFAQRYRDREGKSSRIHGSRSTLYISPEQQLQGTLLANILLLPRSSAADFAARALTAT